MVLYCMALVMVYLLFKEVIVCTQPHHHAKAVFCITLWWQVRGTTLSDLH